MYHVKSILIILFLIQCLVGNHQLPSHLLLDENHIDNFESFKSKLNRLQDKGKQFTENTFSYANEEWNENEQGAIFEEFVTLFRRSYVHDKTEYRHRFSIFKVKKSFNRFVLTSSLSWRRSLSYRNQSIDFLCKSKYCFLYDSWKS